MTRSTTTVKLADGFAELESIVQKFESGSVDLEEGIPMFKRGLELARDLKQRLSLIENEIKEVKAEFADLEQNSSQEPQSVTETSTEIPF